MIKEQEITLETAKIAKEKGFPNKDNMCNGIYINGRYDSKESYAYYYTNNHNIFPAPTQSLLQKWLRESHNTDIQIIPYGNGYHVTATKTNYTYNNTQENKSYEEALEIALKNSLLQIKNIKL